MAVETSRDLVLSPNEYAFILDGTKGLITVFVGPQKANTSETDRPVVFNYKTKKFTQVALNESIQTFTIAPEGWYIELKNPSKDGKKPEAGKANTASDLTIGHKENIPGPCSFPLWPGQMAEVHQGHQIRSNQYLVARIYDEESATKNRDKMGLTKKNNVPTPPTKPEKEEDTEKETETKQLTKSTDMEIVNGVLFIIKGTDQSFYIPPTGVEVVPFKDAKGADTYIRDAVTLETMEYCILLDEDGNKRYVRGPEVVFPKPTEHFMTGKSGELKFKAIVLNEISGIYIQVIADYEEGGKKFEAGDELFITGEDQPIYFPRPEHAIVRYGDQDVHFGVAIPLGEARYVLDRMKGEITLEKGPQIFLGDPRKEVIVLRILPKKKVELYYPGNYEAIEHNAALEAEVHEDLIGGEKLNYMAAPPAAAMASSAYRSSKSLERAMFGDTVKKKDKFTEPRTVTLDTKYQGAVTINVWTGYAVQIVGKTGKRRVVEGPQTVLLEYEEDLESMELSTGTPKINDRTLQTVYLRTKNNKVSDEIKVETKDLCRVKLHLSYAVNFEGDSNKWFDVEDYVKFLCDHMRSMLKNMAKQHNIAEFYEKAISYIRDTVLGPQLGEGKTRTGRPFEDNGMKIYEVEVLGVTIEDRAVSDMLSAAQITMIGDVVRVAKAERALETTMKLEVISQKDRIAKKETRLVIIQSDLDELLANYGVSIKKIAGEYEQEQLKLKNSLENTVDQNKIDVEELKMRKIEFEQELIEKKAELDLVVQELVAKVDVVVKKAQAITPGLVEALSAFSKSDLLGKLSQAMSPIPMYADEGMLSVIERLFHGTIVGNILETKETTTSGTAIEKVEK